MIDDVINNLIENDQLTSEEIEKLSSELNVTKKTSKIDNVEDELRKELGDDFEEIIDNIDIDNLDDLDNLTDLISGELDKKKKVKSIGIKISSSKSSKSRVDIDDEPEEDLKPKKKITVKTIKNNTEEIKEDIREDNKEDNKVNASVSIDIKNKYKNRQ